MQRAPLATLYGLDYREPIQWPLGKRKRERGREREREREGGRESVLLIKMARFVFITIAILKTRFVFLIIAILMTRFVLITTVIINPLQVNIHDNKKSRTGQEKRRESRERDTYLGMRRVEPLL